MLRLIPRLVPLFLVLFTLAVGPAAGQNDIWAPPAPSAAERDWIRLTSGEWLWGTIDLMRDETLEFDSEKLDGLTIDWVDIVEIRSARPMTFVQLDGSVVTGTSTLKGDTLRVETSSGTREIPRSQVHAILEGNPTELNFWSIKVGAAEPVAFLVRFNLR